MIVQLNEIHEVFSSEADIRDADYEQMRRETVDLINLRSRGIKNLSELEIHFRKWENIAERLVIGAGKVNKSGNSIRKGVAEFEDKFVDLYRFLLRMLGVYDKAIHLIMKDYGRPELHKKMQGRILNHFR